MSNTRKHRSLLARIGFLESNLLPPVKVNGNYTKKESDMIRGYLLLCHAEIESFFEEAAKSKVQNALNLWRTTRRKSHCLLAVMSFCTEEINWEKVKTEDKEKFDFRVNKVVSHYINKLNSNHGIKSKNIKNILLPIGIEESQLDPAWLSIMDSFGGRRGTIAHSSVSVQAQIDLVTERNNINNNVLPEIANLDILIKALR